MKCFVGWKMPQTMYCYMVIKSNNINIDLNDLKVTKLVYKLTKQLLSENENGVLFDYYSSEFHIP